MTHLGMGVDSDRGCQAHSGQGSRDSPHLAGSVGHWIPPTQAPPTGCRLDGFLPRDCSHVSVSSYTDFVSPGKVLQVEFRQPFQADSPKFSGGGGGSQVMVESSQPHSGSHSGSSCSRPSFDYRPSRGSPGRVEVLRKNLSSTSIS